MDSTVARYLEYMVHDFYEGVVVLIDQENFDEGDLETVYAVGYDLFSYGNHGAAKIVFTRLAEYAPYTAHYWRALGAVNQQMKNYPEAIDAYSMAIANDDLDVVSLTYRGETQVLSGDSENGLSDFKRVLEIFENTKSPERKAWAVRCRLLVKIHGGANDAA